MKKKSLTALSSALITAWMLTACGGGGSSTSSADSPSRNASATTDNTSASGSSSAPETNPLSTTALGDCMSLTPQEFQVQTQTTVTDLRYATPSAQTSTLQETVRIIQTTFGGQDAIAISQMDANHRGEPAERDYYAPYTAGDTAIRYLGMDYSSPNPDGAYVYDSSYMYSDYIYPTSLEPGEYYEHTAHVTGKVDRTFVPATEDYATDAPYSFTYAGKETLTLKSGKTFPVTCKFISSRTYDVPQPSSAYQITGGLGANHQVIGKQLIIKEESAITWYAPGYGIIKQETHSVMAEDGDANRQLLTDIDFEALIP